VSDPFNRFDMPAAGEIPSDDGALGARIGPYRVLRELGRGGQGEVYLARDERLGRDVALKVLSRRGALDAAALERFRREAALASKLDHPGICTVYDAGQDRGTPYLAMRFVVGESLAKRLAAVRAAAAPPTLVDAGHVSLSSLPGTSADPAAAAPPPAPVDLSSASPRTPDAVAGVLRLVEGAARALHAAHEAGVVHRDVKPGNLMATPEGESVVLDFGLAQDLAGDLPSLSRTGDVIGTPAYMSPEQISSTAGRVDRRTDVYSLGVTLFECLTLRRPFEAPTWEGVLRAIATGDVPDVRRFNPDVSGDLAAVVATATDRDRGRRYATALDFAEDLRRVRLREPVAAKPAGPFTKLVRWAQRNPALAASLALLVVALTAGLATSLTLLGRTSRALEEATAERNAKRTALAEYDRLSDVSRHARLVERADELWPATPERAAELRAWIADAEKLAATLDAHRAVLAALRASDELLPESDADLAADRARDANDAERRAAVALERQKTVAAIDAVATSTRPDDAAEAAALRERVARFDVELAALDAGLAARRTWRFRAEPVQFKHDATQRLVAALEAFVDPDPHRGALASVRRRLAFVESAAETSQGGANAAAWAAARADAADPTGPYRGLALAPQRGLRPIGRNPRTGLWEFLHLETTADEARGGPLPARRADGGIELREGDGLVFVLVPGGTFRMGARKPTVEESEDAADGEPPPPNVDAVAKDDEKPPHDVALAPFFVSKYELTQGQWARLTGANPSRFFAGQRRGGVRVTRLNPATNVSWNDLAGESGALTRLGLDLPTEAQWEYACRAGSGFAWSTGPRNADLAAAANVLDGFARRMGAPPSLGTPEAWEDGHWAHAPVGSFAPNAFGLHDVHGNVWEWCRDWYVPYEGVARRAGDGLALGEPPARFRVNRGGSFYFVASYARSASRDYSGPASAGDDMGARPCRALDPPSAPR
jgi:formylglycine-generating enzyme required for sulfatase activity/serine/threonine protein kinase